MSRRGFLGGLAAVLGGGALGGGEVGAAGVGRAEYPSGLGAGQVTAAGTVWLEEAQKSPQALLFRKAMRQAYDQRHRLERRLSLTGGVPPGILACKSWRPWFAAVAVERWRDEHMPDMSLVERAIRISAGLGVDDDR